MVGWNHHILPTLILEQAMVLLLKMAAIGFLEAY